VPYDSCNGGEMRYTEEEAAAAVGGAGEDYMQGGAGVDTMYGGVGNDSLDGGDGNDVVRGEGGANMMDGGAGTDDLYGGLSSDVFFGDAGQDDIVADGGNDKIYTGSHERRKDRARDTVNCGAGKDTVYFEKGVDAINKNCEVRRAA
jgi:Ca2+-binding RTX toxin-like protein